MWRSLLDVTKARYLPKTMKMRVLDCLVNNHIYIYIERERERERLYFCEGDYCHSFVIIVTLGRLKD